MGTSMMKLVKTAAKSKSIKPSRATRAAGLIYQMNKIVNTLRGRKFTGSAREAAKFARMVKGSRA